MIRRFAISMVLGTEMKQHFSMMGTFHAKLTALESMLLHAASSNAEGGSSQVCG